MTKSHFKRPVPALHIMFGAKAEDMPQVDAEHIENSEVKLRFGFLNTQGDALFYIADNDSGARNLGWYVMPAGSAKAYRCEYGIGATRETTNEALEPLLIEASFGHDYADLFDNIVTTKISTPNKWPSFDQDPQNEKSYLKREFFMDERLERLYGGELETLEEDIATGQITLIGKPLSGTEIDFITQKAAKIAR